MELIELYDEDGNLVQFNLLDSFEIDDEKYIVFEDLEDDYYYYIYKAVATDSGEIDFLPIEDEKELQEVDKLYQELLDNLEGE